MSLRGDPVLRNVVVSAVCLAIAVLMIVSNTHSRGAPTDLAGATGILNEWSVIGRGKTLRFTFDNDHRDFRVDPIYFRGAMNQKVPGEFRRGAKVEVLARKTELASTSGSANIWVRNISVDGKSVLDAKSVDSAAASNDRLGYAFVLLALAALIYNLIRWQFPGAQSNNSLERTRKR